ncbi:MAG: excalibur calcium-binding domain-containing protein [Candidatus Marithrix sp.]
MNKTLIILILSIVGCSSVNTYDTNKIHKTQLSQKKDIYHLLINVIPSDSKIINIKPKYKPNIELKAGKYNILVERKGYKKYRKWIQVNSDLSIDIKLKQNSKPKKRYKPKKVYKSTSSTSNHSCAKKYCKNMNSCEEAYYQLRTCGYRRLDRDNDGVPCESICPGG